MRSTVAIVAVVAIAAVLVYLALTQTTVATLVDSDFNAREKRYAPRIVSQYQRAGLPPEYGLATAYVESKFNPDSVNPKDPTAAWGMFQELGRNAGAAGYHDGSELLDFETALAANIELVSSLNALSIPELASRYNSGKSLDNAPLDTRLYYVPSIVAAADRYRARLNAGEWA